MIYAFTGKTGSSKTYKMVEMARSQWLKGRDIYSNTILLFSKTFPNGGQDIYNNPEEFNLFEKLQWSLYRLFKNLFAKGKINPKSITRRGRIVYFQNILEIMEVEDGLVLFDEAQVLFNARNWESLPSEFQYKLQQSRKHNIDLFCTAQNLGTIDITYRRLIHQWFHCERGWTIGNDPVLFGFFRIHIKDVDQLFNQVDDLKVENVSTKTFIIHKWKPRYYDTFYDIGFSRLKIIWLNVWNQETRTFRRRWMILPKNLSLAQGLRAISTLRQAYGMSRLSAFSAKSKRY